MTDQTVRVDSRGAAAEDERQILEIVEEVLQRNDIQPTGDLFDAGITSLSLIRILVQVNKRFGTALTGAELGDTASVSRLATCVRAATEEI